MEQKNVQLVVLQNGPIMVNGVVDVTYNGVGKVSDKPVYLCRCGASKNKPYCDGSHKTIGFED